eukprot:9229442-Pyramimonas_sp.AAC.1
MHQPEDVQIMLTRHRRAAFVVNAHDGGGTFVNAVGCYMGDSDAAPKFRVAFEQPTQEWRAFFSLRMMFTR